MLNSAGFRPPDFKTSSFVLRHSYLHKLTCFEPPTCIKIHFRLAISEFRGIFPAELLGNPARNNSKQHQNTDNHYEEDCYHRSYRRRFRVLPAAAAAAAGDPRGCSSDRGSHQEVSDSRIGIPILLYTEKAPIPSG